MYPYLLHSIVAPNASKPNPLITLTYHPTFLTCPNVRPTDVCGAIEYAKLTSKNVSLYNFFLDVVVLLVVAAALADVVEGLFNVVVVCLFVVV